MRVLPVISATLALTAVFAVGAVLAQAVAPPPADPSFTDQLIADACANQGAWIKYVASLLGVSTGASALANYRDKLPQPIRGMVDLIALNFRNVPPPAPPANTGTKP